MVFDETIALRQVVSVEVTEAIDALTTLNKLFGRETISAAIGSDIVALIKYLDESAATVIGTSMGAGAAAWAVFC